MSTNTSQDPFDVESLIMASFQSGGFEDPGSVKTAKLFRIGRSVEYVLEAVRTGSPETGAAAAPTYNALLAEAQDAVGSLADEMNTVCVPLPATATQSEAQVALSTLDAALSGVLLTHVAHRHSSAAQERLVQTSPALAQALGATPAAVSVGQDVVDARDGVTQLAPGYL